MISRKRKKNSGETTGDPEMSLGSHYYRLSLKSILQCNSSPSLKDFQSKLEKQKYCEQILRIFLCPLARKPVRSFVCFSLFFQ